MSMLQFLSHAKQDIPADGDPIALAIVLGVLLAFVVWVFIDKSKKKKAAAAAVAAPAPAETPATVTPTAPGSAGKLKLYNVEPKTAAMIMAIVANKMGKPLNELRFISFKEVE